MIEITYDGRILETDPGRIHTVYRIRIAQKPDDPRAYESGGNVRERENAPDDMEWQDGISFSDLAPGGEIVSPFEIVMEENDSSLWLSITWARNGQALEYGIRSEDGTAYFQEKQGGSGVFPRSAVRDRAAGIGSLPVIFPHRRRRMAQRKKKIAPDCVTEDSQSRAIFHS